MFLKELKKTAGHFLNHCKPRDYRNDYYMKFCKTQNVLTIVPDKKSVNNEIYIGLSAAY